MTFKLAHWIPLYLIPSLKKKKNNKRALNRVLMSVTDLSRSKSEDNKRSASLWRNLRINEIIYHCPGELL